MKGSKLFALLLCCVFCMVLLAACGEQAAEAPALTQPTTGATQPQGVHENNEEEGELSADTVPQQTQPVTDATGETEPGSETKPTEPPKETKPTEPSNQTQPTEVSEPSQPTETESTEPEPTQPVTTTPEATEPTEPPELDEDELPLVPLF